MQAQALSRQAQLSNYNHVVIVGIMAPTSELASPETPEMLAALVRASKLPPLEERRRIRTEAKIPLRRMGAAIGVSGMTVLEWERGTGEPTLENAARYADLLARLAKAIQSS
jgi:DNA-binding XRE family transcriptional regulator